MSPDDLTLYCDRFRHLVCTPYSIDNLHRMARELNIGPHWFHRGKLPHYDIPKRRVAEIMARCTVLGQRKIVKIVRGRA